jgi:hypothetical protein
MTELAVDTGADVAPPMALERTAPADTPAALSSIDAAAVLRKLRRQDSRTTDQTPPERADTAAPEAEQESTAQDADDAAPAPQDPGEKTENADPASFETGATRPPQDEGLPPIEPPRSWTKEDKELFASLPRATQERLAERERSRQSGGTLAGRALTVFVDAPMCNNCQHVLPYVGLELGNPTVTCVGPRGSTRTMYDGAWVDRERQ